MLLLRLCMLPRLSYLARVVSPGTLAPRAKDFDNTVIREKLGLPPSLDNVALLPLSLPIRLGGFGFRSVRLASPGLPLPAPFLTFWSLFPTVIVLSVVNLKPTSLRM